MVWSVAFSCDFCGKGKGEANHWWMARLNESHEASTPAASAITLMRWTSVKSQDPDIFHLCGQNCALQAVERFMTEGAIDPP